MNQLIFLSFYLLSSLSSLSYAARVNSSLALVEFSVKVGNLSQTPCESCPKSFLFTKEFQMVDPDRGDTVNIEFFDPLPYGYVLQEVQLDITCSYDCSPKVERTELFVLLGRTVLTSLYKLPLDKDSCICIACQRNVSVPSEGPKNWWQDYNYTDMNTLQFIFIGNLAAISMITVKLYALDINPVIDWFYPSLSPSTNDDATELTIVGSNFIPLLNYKCDFTFNSTIIYSTMAIAVDPNDYRILTCSLPKYLTLPSPLMSVELWIYPVTHSKLRFWNSTGPFNFQFYQQPLLTSISPPTGSSSGGTEVEISGTGFFPTDNLYCLFGYTPVIANFKSSTRVTCIAPPEPQGSVVVKLSENQISWTNTTLLFTYELPPPPPLSPVVLNTYLLIGGAIFLVVLTLGVLAVAYFRGKRDAIRAGYSHIRESFNSELIVPLTDLAIKEVIGRGSFGIVYRAYWRHTVVAVKMIDLDPNDSLISELYEEAKLMISLRHPNVVTFMGVTLPPDVCIITEYVSRGSLYSILHDTKVVIEPDHIRKFALDTCMGMAYLHGAKIIHRDLKTHNLLVDKGWNIKVCDFGMSRPAEEKIKTMTACGTPCWTAPEVLRSQRYSFKADVYSFGICFWEMISRESPYGSMPPYQVVISVATKGLRPAIPATCFEPFRQVITASWNEDPNARPSFGKLVEFLEATTPPQSASPFPFVVKPSPRAGVVSSSVPQRWEFGGFSPKSKSGNSFGGYRSDKSKFLHKRPQIQQHLYSSSSQGSYGDFNANVTEQESYVEIEFNEGNYYYDSSRSSDGNARIKFPNSVEGPNEIKRNSRPGQMYQPDSLSIQGNVQYEKIYEDQEDDEEKKL